jgi:murein DD-endopeptidase MepM/ murein hydrolase activator NlpD
MRLNTSLALVCCTGMIAAGCNSSSEPVNVPLPAPVPEAAPAPPTPMALTVTDAHIKKNGTLSQLLRDQDVDDAAAWISALATVTDIRKLRQNDTVHLLRREDGTLERLVLEKSEWERAVVAPRAPESIKIPFVADELLSPQRELSPLTASLERDNTVLASEMVEIEVSSSLYQALVGAGWDASLAFELADVFAYDLDFYTDVQRGDRVLAWVDVRRRESGQFIAYGKLHAAIYAGQVGRFSAYRFQPEGGVEAFYDDTGRSLRKEFLKSPLKYAHVTSHFGSRRHPVLGFTRQHAGVDFQASVGTPVWAVGDGKVTSAGWLGGYGKCVTVRHPNGMESLYAHLSQIHVRVGQHIAQKSLVGASGNTGLSSGPHLHFGLKRLGAFMNPLSWKPPRVEPLAQQQLPLFRTAIESVANRMADALAKRFSAR